MTDQERDLRIRTAYIHARWAYLQTLHDLDTAGLCPSGWRAEIKALAEDYFLSLRSEGA